MTNKEAERWARLVRSIGPEAEGWSISRDDLEALRRIEMTLHRWAERECNGEVEVDDDGRAFSVYCYDTDGMVGDRNGGTKRYRIPNREAGALRRLAAIMARYPHLRAYHQTDPRGCALYIYQLAKMDGHDPDAYYSSCALASGVAICR